MKDVYRQLGLRGFDHAEAAMTAYLRGQGEYQPNVFELTEGLRAKITKRWAGYIKRFGYQDAVKDGETS